MTLREEDLIIDTYRSGTGVGVGFHPIPFVAVRIIHKPTGIKVQREGGGSMLDLKADAISELQLLLDDIGEDLLDA